MRFTFFLLILFCLGLLNGCCTKKACPCLEQAIELRFKNGTYTREDIFIAIFEKSNFAKPTDTVMAGIRPPCNGCDYDYDSYNLRSGEPVADLRQYSYIVFDTTAGLADTIFSIDYTTQTVTDKCNSCFLAKDEYSCEVRTNEILNINGQTYYTSSPDYLFKQ